MQLFRKLSHSTWEVFKDRKRYLLFLYYIAIAIEFATDLFWSTFLNEKGWKNYILLIQWNMLFLLLEKKEPQEG